MAERLIVGRNFVGTSNSETQERVAALVAANVAQVITLLSLSEINWMRAELDAFDFEAVFQHHYFPILGGHVPSPANAAYPRPN
jgi:hypothetical protein